MKKDWLENKLNDKLADYGSELDLDQAWSSLSAKRRRKRRAAWWILPLLLLVGLGGYLYLDNQPGTLAEDAKTTTSIPGDQTDKQLTVIDPSTDLNNNESIITANPVSPGENNKFMTTPASNREQAVQERKVITKQSSEIQSAKMDSPSSSNLSFSQKEKEQVANTINAKDKSLLKESASDKLDHTVKSASSDVMLPFSLLYPEVDSPGILPIEVPAAVDEVMRKRSGSGLSIGLQAGYGVLARELSPNGDSLALIRMRTEDPVDYWSAGIFLRKQLGSNWMLKIGLQLEESFTRLQSNKQRTYTEMQPDQILSIYENANGEIEMIRGEGEVTVTENSMYDLWQRYRGFAIPLGVGYTVSGGNLVSFRPVIGLTWIFSQQVKGKTLVRNGDESILEDLDLLYSNSNLLQLNASFELDFQWTDQFSTLVSVGGGFDVTDRAAIGQLFNDRFQRIGLQVGAFYQW